MKVYFFKVINSARVEGASLYLNDVYRMMEGYSYNNVRMYTATISPCVYALYKSVNSKGKTQDDNFWIARYLEQNEGVLKKLIRKPNIAFLRSFWKGAKV